MPVSESPTRMDQTRRLREGTTREWGPSPRMTLLRPKAKDMPNEPGPHHHGIPQGLQMSLRDGAEGGGTASRLGRYAGRHRPIHPWRGE